MRAEPPRRITSASNPTIKLLRSLDRKKARREAGMFLAEGARTVSEAMEMGWAPRVLVVTDDAQERTVVRQLLDRALAGGCEVLEVPPRLMESLSRRENAQNVLAAFTPATVTLQALELGPDSMVVVLDRPRDPGNLGTIVRTADAVGAQAVVLCGESVDPFSPEAVRASMGSLFVVPIVETDEDDLLEWRARTGIRFVGTALQATDPFDGWPVTGASAVVMGTEQSGLTDTLRQACDHLVRIPMRGRADSLNLAVSTGVMLYETWRRRGGWAAGGT
jgi:TrmH family RNA methyltransferase